MYGLPLRHYLKHPLRAVAAIAAEPLEIWTVLQEGYLAQHERPVPRGLYEAEDGWDRRMHERLGLPWPCPATSEFVVLWPKVIGELEAKGIRVGPDTLYGWNDGDAGLMRSIWCLTRHLRPRNVVETGVLHGVTSRLILEALERNGSGHLWSIDLPPLEDGLQDQIGIAVDDRSRARWTYIRGTSKRHLPGLLSKLGQIDIFIHDSLHSERNVSLRGRQGFRGFATWRRDCRRRHRCQLGIPLVYAFPIYSHFHDLRGRAASSRHKALQQQGDVWPGLKGADCSPCRKLGRVVN